MPENGWNLLRLADLIWFVEISLGPGPAGQCPGPMVQGTNEFQSIRSWLWIKAKCISTANWASQFRGTISNLWSLWHFFAPKQMKALQHVALWSLIPSFQTDLIDQMWHSTGRRPWHCHRMEAWHQHWISWRVRSRGWSMGRTVKAWLPKTNDYDPSSPWACQISGHFASVQVPACALFIFLDSCSCSINVHDDATASSCWFYSTYSFLFSPVLFYSFLILHMLVRHQVLQPAETRTINRFLLSTIFGQS